MNLPSKGNSNRQPWWALPTLQRNMAIAPLCLLNILIAIPSVLALPPADDPPEEVLRSEIILDARSNIDGDALTAAEYVQEQEAIAQSAYAPELDPAIQQVIFLLQVRRALKPILPFIP